MYLIESHRDGLLGSLLCILRMLPFCRHAKPSLHGGFTSGGDIPEDRDFTVGDLPCGAIVECYGEDIGDMASVTLRVVAHTQQSGGTAVLIDAEHSFDATSARGFGVDVDNLLVVQPSSGEEASSICELLARSGAIDTIVVNSIAAITMQSEVDADFEKREIRYRERETDRIFRNLASCLSDTGTSCLITMVKRGNHGDKADGSALTPGEKALERYAVYRIGVVRKIAA